jgi:putative FmdB family regulatory protein
MPIYEYKCSDCGTTYEKRQKFSDPADVECNCEKKAAVQRLTSAPALVFKGSGWYINDYARAGSKDGKNGGASDGKGASAKSESKPANSSGDSGSSSSSDSSSASKSTPAPASS